MEVLLHTNLVRDDLFTWQDRIIRERNFHPVRVDTWAFEDHPAPNGGEPFTLYACTLVYGDDVGRAVREEREACAQILDARAKEMEASGSTTGYWMAQIFREQASAIRARG